MPQIRLLKILGSLLVASGITAWLYQNAADVFTLTGFRVFVVFMLLFMLTNQLVNS